MDLEGLYFKVKESIGRLDLSSIWPGFKPLKFALYDSEKCFFDGRFIEKTPAFCANTSISFEGEQIAIWMVQEELEIPVLTAKLMHEMFHGFQTLSGWDCWPNEMEALQKYRYRAENLSIKLRENELLLSLLGGFESGAYSELIECRKIRSEKFPSEFTYESEFEEIEGTANYVEWQVLRQLDGRAADALADRMREVMTKPGYLFPIRISCYFTGALMINAMISAGDYTFTPSERPVIKRLLKDMSCAGDMPERPLNKEVSDAIDSFEAATDSIIRTALENNEVVLGGGYELVFVNIYNARCRGGYITSEYFVMYRDGEEEKMLPGNYVVKMRDEKTIDCVYRWK